MLQFPPVFLFMVLIMNELDDLVKDTNDNELIMLYRDNDENAKNLLFYKYKYIIDILINKHMRMLKRFNVDMQEAYSECNVGFSNGLKSYDEEKDASLVTFVTICIERRLGNLIRKYKNEKHKVMQETYSLDYDYKDGSLLDTIKDDYIRDPLIDMASDEKVEEIIEEAKFVLTNREFEVFNLMAAGFDYKEIAAILKKTNKQVDNTIQRIKIKMKKIIEEKENF